MYAVIVLDGSGREAGRYDYMDDQTGLISVGGGPEDHIYLPDLPPAQVYLYVTGGEMVVENPLGNAAVLLNGYAIDQPSYADPDTDIQVQGYWIRIVRLDKAPPPPAPGSDATPAASQQSPMAPTAGELDTHEAPLPPESEDSARDQGYFEGAAAQVALDLAFAPGGPATATGPLVLEGVDGLVKGKTFLLEEGKEYDVGRDEILEIHLPDPTVSRRHARLKVTEGGLSVLDLRSTNGTYVNGERVKRQVALPGDRIRFGEVAFRLKRQEESKPEQPGAAPKPKPKAAPMRKGILVAGAVAVAALVLVVAMGVRQRLKRKKRGPDAATRALQIARAKRLRFRRLLDRAADHMDHQRWVEAMEALQQALEDYPSLEAKKQAQAQLEKVKRELQAKKTMEEADELFGAAGTDIEALKRVLKLYASIPKDSFYYPKARHQQAKVRLLLARQFESRAMAYNKKRSLNALLAAQDYFCKFFDALEDYPEPVPTESRNRELLRELEKYLAKRLKSRKDKPFEPCRAKRYLHEFAAGGADVKQKILAQYPYRPIAEAILQYARGRVDQGLSALVTLRTKRKARSHLAQIRLLQERLALLKAKLAEVDAALHRRDPTTAAQRLEQARTIERKLLPEGVTSFALREAAHRLAELYFALGDEQFRIGRYESCYRYWIQGKKFEPSNPKILNGLVKLDKKARAILLEAKAALSSDADRAKRLLERVRNMTSEDSPLHKEAVQLLSKLGGR